MKYQVSDDAIKQLVREVYIVCEMADLLKWFQLYIDQGFIQPPVMNPGCWEAYMRRLNAVVKETGHWA